MALVASPRPRAAGAVAIAIAALGLITVVLRVGGPADGSDISFGWADWTPEGVRTSGSVVAPPLRRGDLITALDGRRLSDGPGALAAASPGDVLDYELVRDGVRHHEQVRLTRAGLGARASVIWAMLVYLVMFAAVAWWLGVRRPDVPALAPLQICAGAIAGTSVAVLAGMTALDVATASPLFWVHHLVMIAGAAIGWGGVIALALVPLREAWTVRYARLRAVAYLGPVGLATTWAGVLALVRPAPPIRLAGLIHAGQGVVALSSVLIASALAIVAYRVRATPESRPWLRWILGGGAVSALLAVVLWLLPDVTQGRHMPVSEGLGFVGVPFLIGLTVAILRYRLFAIERLRSTALSRATAMGALSLFGLGLAASFAALAHSHGVAASAVAAALVALVVVPLHRAARRLLYGDSSRALAQLGERLGSAPLPTQVLPAVVETVAEELRLPYVAVELADGADAFRLAEQRGSPIGAIYRQPLRNQGQVVGRLLVSGRDRDDPLPARDLALLGGLARQIGVAIHAVLLHQDLVRSRSLAVTSREDERRRLRRQLHDEVGPALSALVLGIDGARRQMRSDRDGADSALVDIRAEIQRTVGEIRLISYGLRPPVLDEVGLAQALREHARSFDGAGPRFEFEVPELGQIPAAAEVAAFRIAAEAMTNAARHAGADRCVVRIDRGSGPGVLRVEIVDDGRGLPDNVLAGVGMCSMRERADELGGSCEISRHARGGTQVVASLPLEEVP